MKRTPLLRKAPFRRGPSKLRRKSRVLSVNRKRKAKEFKRCYGSKERVEWIKSRPCVACGGRRFIENAHVGNGGMSRKADAQFVVPLCHDDHRALHDHGVESFEPLWGIDLHAEAARTEAMWQMELTLRAAQSSRQHEQRESA